ncbi:hypothetical protein APUTEX25_003497, partial [Auxenochlorella protothecoides]
MVSGITPPSTRASVMVPPGASPPSRCVTPGSLPFRPAHTRPGQSHASRPVTCQGASTAPARTGLATPDDSPTHFPRGKHWQVHKFGGTCLATPERIDAVCRYLTSPEAAGERRERFITQLTEQFRAPPGMTTIVGVGNWSAQDRGGIMRGPPPGPWIRFLRRLRRYVRVHNGVEKLVDVWDTKRCTNRGCKVNVVNRDVNG